MLGEQSACPEIAYAELLYPVRMQSDLEHDGDDQWEEKTQLGLVALLVRIRLVTKLVHVSEVY